MQNIRYYYKVLDFTIACLAQLISATCQVAATIYQLKGASQREQNNRLTYTFFISHI